MTFGAYLFDLDGTLIDSVALILGTFHHVRERHFGDRLPDAYYLETLGMPLRDSFAKMATPSESVEALVKTYVEYNLAHHDSMVRPYDGVVAMIATLRDRGARLALVTSKMSKTALRGLTVANIADAFELIVSADDVKRGKPHPEPVLLALSKLGVIPSAAVFVGDSPHDVEAGNAAGVKTAAATWGPFTRASLEDAKPTYFVASPADVLVL
ncbi:MAG TPA: HAD-IA family hydrolase [Polyangiaceae bacterium]|jgi:pyrophosphatase PpaX|nr:HAD-IA family hydrolase [Polyangiaceae bacterium]